MNSPNSLHLVPAALLLAISLLAQADDGTSVALPAGTEIELRFADAITSGE